MLIVIILIVLLCGGGFGYLGHQSYPGYGPGIGIGTVLIVLLICYALGLFR